MKRLLLIAAIPLLFACNKNLESNEVPGTVIQSFKQKYPDVTRVKWEEKKDGLIEANFSVRGELIEVLFKPDGTIVEIDG